MKWPLARQPYHVQQVAFDLGVPHIGPLDGFGYFMEQGLGKTGVAYADFVAQLGSSTIDDCMVVILPNYLKSNWVDEAQFWGVSPGVAVHAWPDVPERADILKPPYVFIINKEAILFSGGVYLQRLLLLRRHMLVLDESSFIKSPKSAISKKCRALKGDAAVVRELTGTPMTQGVIDLWSQLRFLGAVNGWQPEAFRNHFAVRGGYMGKQETGLKNEPELHALLNKCSFRALKADWLDDLPEKIYPAPREFEMTKKQRQMYADMHTEFYAEINDKEVFAEQVITAMMKLTQISRGFIIDEDRVIEQIMPISENPALQLVKEIVEHTVVTGKVIIFAFYKHSIAILQEMFGAAVLRGGMKPDQIKAEKDKFNNDPTCRVLVAQESVGAMGHTLLGQAGKDRCSTTIFYENSYSREKRSQMEDRNHRIGQDKGVVYIDIFGSPLDKKIATALQRKQDMVTAIVDAVRQTRR